MSDARRLRLEVVLQAIDKATAPFRQLTERNKALARAVKESRDQLKQLDRAQANIDSFRKLSKDAAVTANQLQAVRTKASDLGRQMRQTAQPSATLTKAFAAARRESQALKQRQTELQANLQHVRARLAEAGIGTQDLARHQRELRSRVAATNEQFQAQQKRLSAVAAQNKRVATAQASAERMRATAGKLTAAGAGAGAAGVAVGLPLMGGIHEAKHYAAERVRISALGLGDKATTEALDFAKQMKAYGVSETQKAELMRDALSVFADTHHAEMAMPTLAKMKFANAAVFGEADGAENERKFMDMLKVVELRGGLASKEAFTRQADMIQKVVTATGGRVQAEEWLNTIKTGGLAAKGMDDKAFYYAMEPLVQEMGGNRVGTAMMSAYQNLYQGKTTKRALANIDRFGLIDDRTKVKNDKAGQISFMDPGALKGADLFRKNQFAWMEQVLLPALASKGIKEKDQILDAIGSMFSNRTASNLFSQMYLQREQIHKNMRLNEGAAGIDELAGKARDMPQAAELQALAKKADLQKALGETILPLYVKGLELAGAAADRLTRFIERHPTAAKATIVTIGALAAALLVIGPILLAIGSVLWPLAVLRTAMAALTGGAGVFSGALRLLAGGFNLLMRSVGLVGTVLMWLGRLALANPLLAVITLIAAGALYIWQNWDTLGPKFAALWQGIKDAFGRAWDWIKEKAQGAADWFSSAKDKLLAAGRDMIDGLLAGISERWTALKQKVSELADGVAGWFKDKLGIHSPSRVFAQLGSFTMQGLTQGLAGGQADPLKTMTTLAGKLAAIGAGVAFGTGAAAGPVRFDARPALTTASAVAPTGAASPAPITIVINPPAGTDERMIARMVADELRRIENQRAARQRSRLTDKG